jgi:tetratricopeptide (TPR) repeat protein
MSPASPNPDRNLLYGILALQMDFVNRDALIAAMNAWVLAKQKPLGDLLQEHGALTPENRHVLDLVTAAHLKAHGDDPQRSLAAVGQLSTLDGALQSVADPDLQVRIAAAGKNLATTADRRTEDGLRYRLLRPHARGGLGVVWVARDIELGREVALKEIDSDQATDAVSQGRFVREAEITGGLEHPGIVPVYGLGHYADGRPYYAMRFIRGETLEEAVRKLHASEAAYTLRDLLTRYVAVCNAVAYAHSRGVIHRDLKPANVMLGPYGETLVVDWGLAKVIGPEPASNGGKGAPAMTLQALAVEGSMTQAGSALGTPSFMSPEQARGEMATLGPATDVYGLGATLYALLTGRPPIQGPSTEEVLEKVRQGNWEPPRRVQGSIPPPLDAVCRKALALRPEDRYATALALAADVEAWLADEPVSAWREPRTARIRRWIGRHRTPVTAAAATALVGALSLAAATVLLSRANGQLQAANHRERDAKDRAEVSYRLARAGLEKVTATVRQDPRLQAGGMEDLRNKVLRAQADFYQQFVALRGDEPSFLQERSDALIELGGVAVDLGSPEESIAAFDQAVAVRERITQENPDHADARVSLAAALGSQGFALLRAGRLRPAETAYRRGLDLISDNGAETPDTSQTQRCRAGLLVNLGFLLHRVKRYPEAEEAYERAIAAWARLAAENPANPDDLSRLSLVWLDSGYLNEEWERPERALEGRRKAITYAEQLNEKWPGVDEHRHLLASAYQYQGWTLQRFGRPGAEAAFLKALPIREQLARDHPLRAEYQAERARLLNSLAWVYQNTGRPSQAEEAYKNAGLVYAGLVERYPGLPEYQRMLAHTYNGRAWLLHKYSGRAAEAEADYLQVLKWRSKLASNDSNAPDDHRDLAFIRENLAELYADTNRPAEARESFRQAVEGLTKLVKNHAGVADYVTALADSHRRVGRFLRSTGQPALALDEFALALAALGPGKKGDTDPAVSEVLADCYADRALTLSKDLGRHDEALRDWDRAIEAERGKTARHYPGRACTVARRGQHAEASAVAEEVVRGDCTADALADAGRALSLASEAAQNGGQTALAVRYASRSVAVFREAVGRGFRDEKTLRTDRELTALRSREDFKQLLAELVDKAEKEKK